VGFFCGARKGEVHQALDAALRGSIRSLELARMRVELNGARLSNRVLNEALFCHVSPAATSRYILRRLANDGATLEEEEQKSSGVWVGPAAGSTAAQQSAGGRVLPLSSRALQYVVREAYRPHGEELGMTRGLVDEGDALTLKSKMRRASIFLDGDHIAYDVTIGEVVTLVRSDEPLVVLGLARDGGVAGNLRGADGD
jgi:NAD+ kinase